MPDHPQAYRASLLQFSGPSGHYQYFADGLLIVRSQRILACGPASALLARWPEPLPVTDYNGQLICAGFVDCHSHYPQLDIIASYGDQLLDWLENYTFPEEQRFADYRYARHQAGQFLQTLLQQGTTSAMVFATVHPQSVDAFFEQALALNLRMICGKVLMDRHAPTALRDTAETGEADSRQLIGRWLGRGRLHYAVSPRFAPTSSPQQLLRAGQLLRDCPGLYLHTHLAENRREIRWVRELFPERTSYLDVYDHYGLLGPHSLFAHALHLEEQEYRRLGESGSAVAFCPSANLFLGSGLLDLARMQHHGIRVGMGTDIGAGTSCSVLQALHEAYKVLQLQGQSLDPFRAFYLATLGGARALGLEQHIGSLEPGKEADFVVLDLQATPLLARRIAQARNLKEQLFALMMLGDSRAVRATYVAGTRVHGC